jgi:hypothetical protein
MQINNKQTLLQEVFYTLKDFGIAWGSIFAIVTGVDQLLQVFKIDFYKVYHLGWLGFYVALLHVLVGASVYTIIAHFIRLRKKPVLTPYNEVVDNEQNCQSNLQRWLKLAVNKKLYRSH